MSFLRTVRPRKKPKQVSSQQKPPKNKSKKPPGGQSCKLRTGPNNPADIDELVPKSAHGPAVDADVVVIIIFFLLSQVRQSYQTGVSRQRLELERCEEIIKKLMKYRYSWPFR